MVWQLIPLASLHDIHRGPCTLRSAEHYTVKLHYKAKLLGQMSGYMNNGDQLSQTHIGTGGYKYSDR